MVKQSFAWPVTAAVAYTVIIAAGVFSGGCAAGPAERARPTAVASEDVQGSVVLSFEESPMQVGGLPTLKASINGVGGNFVIDTGAGVPILTRVAAERCNVTLRPERETQKVDILGGITPMRIARNVTIEFSPHFKVHYSMVYVDASESRDWPWFGIIDYQTLKAANAVIDVSRKTITFSRRPG